MAEEATSWSSVGVVVVGDVAHVVIDVVLVIEVGTYDKGETFVEHGLHLMGRLGIVLLPDDHRDCADLALGDPALIILVEPLGEASGFTEITPGRWHGAHCSTFRERQEGSPGWEGSLLAADSSELEDSS
jgi:hypothetical protein